MGGDAAASGGLDIGSIIGQTAAGGVGGCVLMAIIGAVKQGHGRRGKPLDTIQYRLGFERAHAADEWS